MTIRIVGAGLGRTGTMSLKLALERLTGGRCYHMMEVFGRPDDVGAWAKACQGDMPDWRAFFSEFDACVDWPAAAFWREIADAFPDAPVLLSTRSSTDAWWRSVDKTIWEVGRKAMASPGERGPWEQMHEGIMERFDPSWADESAAKAAYERHNAEVRASVPASRLIDWQPGDGWEPLAAALGVDVPDEPFPHVNSTEEFRTRAGMDAPQ